MSSQTPTNQIPGEGSESDAGGSTNSPLTVPYFFALGLGGGAGAGIGFAVVMAVVDMMKG